MKTFSGRVWKLGDDVNTDQIIAGKYLDNYSPSHLASHALEGVRNDFPRDVKQGDIILAGKNFGCGSSREQAVTALKSVGVSVIVARSFARIFYRNAINLGLPVVTSTDAIDAFDDGETATVDIAEMVLRSEDRGTRATLDAVPLRALEILSHGGLVSYLRTRMSGKGRE